MSRHDIDLVDAEPQAHVQGEIHEEERHREPKELVLSASDDAAEEEQYYDSLY